MGIADLKLMLLICSFVVPFTLAIVLLSQSNKNSVKLLVMGGLLNASAVFFFNYIYFQQYYQLYYYSNALHLATTLWVFPIIYHIFKLLVDSEICYKKALVHLIPGAIIAITSAVLLYGFNTAELGRSYFENYRSGIEFEAPILKLMESVRLINVVFLILQIGYYLLKIRALSQKFRKSTNKSESSNEYKLSISWINMFNYSFTTIALLCVLYYIYTPHKKHEDLFLIIFLFLLSGIILFVAIMALKHKAPIKNLEAACTESYSEVEPDKEDEFIKKIIQKIDSEQLYLNSELTLLDLSLNLNTNRTYLSGVINRKTGMNFNSFLNDFRLKHIAQFELKHPKTSAEKLAEIGGFGSVSSMRRAIKRAEDNEKEHEH